MSFLLLVGIYALFRAVRELQKEQPGPEAKEPKAPEIEEGKPIGVVFGKAKITSATVYWWGDLRSEEIRK
uniref:hypothetical protein n=1 Tax=Thaumasiovibrio occultus TaxID=1891184 RepID=UPI000B34EE51|nr:hypothetical protein [Thaumasiovibrio occultus]